MTADRASAIPDGFHKLVFVSIKKPYPMQAYESLRTATDLNNTSYVLFDFQATTEPQRDSLFIMRPADAPGHAAQESPAETSNATGRRASRRLKR